MTDEEKRAIEKEAKAHALQNESARYFELKPTLRNIALQCSNESYIAGATRMAEKKNLEIEASNVSIKIWKNTAGEFKKCNDDLKAQLEAAQEEIEKREEMINNLEEQVKQRNICNCRFDKEGDCDKFSTMQAELSRVKEVAEKMAKALDQFRMASFGIEAKETDVCILESRLTLTGKIIWGMREALTEFANLMNKEK